MIGIIPSGPDLKGGAAADPDRESSQRASTRSQDTHLPSLRVGPESISAALLIQRVEIVAAVFLLVGLAALHVVYAFVFRLDSDEPQHLHVVWGWTQGQLPYRDFFDNHSPLFSWLCAPLLRVLGERADIVPWMRLAMIPLAALCLGCVYRLGAHLFSRRTGWWAAIATGFFPLFFYTSTEFRPDNLWAAFWLLTLTVLLTGPLTRRRLFFFGLVLGFAFATSMKTTLLAATLVLAGLLIHAANWRQTTTPSPDTVISRVAAVLAGLVLVPGAFTMFFVLEGAWKPFIYCLITHNTLSGMSEQQGWLRLRPLLFPLVVPGIFKGARFLLRQPGREADPWRVQRLFFLLAACGYPLLLVSFWPLLTLQDYLPAVPPLVLVVVAVIFWRWFQPALNWKLFSRLAVAAELPGIALTAMLILGEIATIFCIHGPWRNRTAPDQKLLATTLRLTSSGDPVMDNKGETIFRRRSFYYALEGITQERLRRGLIADDLPERLIATRTAVVHLSLLPLRSQVFVRDNYLSIGILSVLGKIADPVASSTNSLLRRYPFRVEVPARYIILDGNNVPVAGQMDGQPLVGEGQWLASGAHEIVMEGAGKPVVFWANAWEKGFRPVTGSASVNTSHE